MFIYFFSSFSINPTLLIPSIPLTNNILMHNPFSLISFPTLYFPNCPLLLSLPFCTSISFSLFNITHQYIDTAFLFLVLIPNLWPYRPIFFFLSLFILHVSIFFFYLSLLHFPLLLQFLQHPFLIYWYKIPSTPLILLCPILFSPLPFYTSHSVPSPFSISYQ